MDLLRIASRVASGAVTVETAIYDNTHVTTDELVEAVLAIPFEPIWFARHDFGWVASSQDPAGLDGSAPVVGAPFGEETWGEMMGGEYMESAGEFRRCASPQEVLDDDDLLWWFTSGDAAEAADLVQTLRSNGLEALAARVSTWKP